MTWLIGLGAVALLLGLCCDYGNFRLVTARRRGVTSRVSPVVLAPLLFNWFGLMVLFLAVGGYSAGWLLLGWALLLVLHLVGLRGLGR